MAIQTTCAGCGAQYAMKDSLAGRKVRCPKCREIVTVPGAKPAAVEATAAAAAGTVAGESKNSADARRSTAKFVRPQVKKEVQTATACPECGRAMAPGAPACPECGFNVRLGKKLRITQAIKAADRKPGVRADGSTYVTRQEMAEERVKAGRKLQIGMLVGALAIAAFVAAVMMHVAATATEGDPLDVLRVRVAKLPQKISDSGTIITVGDELRGEWFHPYCINMKVDLTVPKARLDLAKVKTPFSGGTPAEFAEIYSLPLYVRKALPAGLVGRVLGAEGLGRAKGEFLPEKLASDPLVPEGGLFVLRESANPAQAGYLSGFLLDLDGQESAFLKELTQTRGYKIAVSGTLYFVPVRESDLSDSAYAEALRREMTLLPTPERQAGQSPAPTAEPTTAKPTTTDGVASGGAPEGEEAAGAAAGDEKYYFIPVVRVEQFQSKQ